MKTPSQDEIYKDIFKAPKLSKKTVTTVICRGTYGVTTVQIITAILALLTTVGVGYISYQIYTAISYETNL